MSIYSINCFPRVLLFDEILVIHPSLKLPIKRGKNFEEIHRHVISQKTANTTKDCKHCKPLNLLL